MLHGVLYGILGALVVRSLSGYLPSRPLAAAATVLLIALAGALDEWHQNLVPGRRADRHDWYADVAGGVAGTLLAMATRRQESGS